MSVLKKIMKFGSMVIGAERAAEQEAEIKSRRTKFGPMVLGTSVVEGTNTPAKDSKFADANKTLKMPFVQKLLKEQPEMAVIYLEAELHRGGDGPRPKLLEWMKKGFQDGSLKVLQPDLTPEQCIAKIDGALDAIAEAEGVE